MCVSVCVWMCVWIYVYEHSCTLSDLVLPEAATSPDGSLSPWICSLLDLKEGSLIQLPDWDFSRNSWYTLSISGHQVALGRA